MAQSGSRPQTTVTCTSSGGGSAPTFAFRSLSGREELGRPFEYQIGLLSTADAIDPLAVLGQSLTVSHPMGEEELRHFNGIVTKFAQGARSGRYTQYFVTIRPKLWLLTRRRNCRVFQGIKVPALVRSFLDDRGIAPVEASLFGTYRDWEYVTQYRETDFDFASRLLEQEGIYYYFKHEVGKHTLVLADSPSSHEPRPGWERVPLESPDWPTGADRPDCLTGWAPATQIRSNAVLLSDFDFRLRKGANLNVEKRVTADEATGELVQYELAEYTLAENSADADAGGIREAGEHYAQVELEAERAGAATFKASGTARGLQTGSLFSLLNVPAAEGKRFLVVATDIELRSPPPESDGSVSGEVCRVGVTVIDDRVPFRPARITPRPSIPGVQTARVVGAGGEEIWTDKYGRIKVQFHWDRFAPGDENTSCWVRVAQSWAGAGWGSIHLPRIGHEVVVQFIEGDPNRPLVTGSVYNSDNMPPYPLPANKTQSGVKSRSTLKGAQDNFNELRFEDKKGSEHVYLQAEKDLLILVKNDERRHVGHDRVKEVTNDETTSVGGNRTETVAKDESITIDGSRDETVAKTESVSIGIARDHTVGAAESLTVGASRTLSVGASDSTSVGGSQSVSVGGSRSVSVGGSQSTDVGRDQSVTVTGGRTVSITKDDSLTISGKRTESITKEATLTIGKKLLVDATEEMTFKSGAATIVLKKSGDISIKGKNISIEGSGKINIKADGDVIVKGSKVSKN